MCECECVGAFVYDRLSGLRNQRAKILQGSLVPPLTILSVNVNSGVPNLHSLKGQRVLLYKRHK